jgi:hypothetical protein
VGSSPIISSKKFNKGKFQSWPNGTDCKSVSYAFSGSNPLFPTKLCGSGSVVEHRLAKARVAGSNPVFRSILI